MIRNKRLTPFHFETAGVRDCYTPEIASTTTPQQTNSTGATESGMTNEKFFLQKIENKCVNFQIEKDSFGL